MDFQHKRNSLNEIVTDKDDIKQCVLSIMGTSKGSVPFCPEFGCDIMPCIGENPESAIDYLIGVYSKELPLQESRVEIEEVTGEADETGKIKMTAYYKIKAENKKDYAEYYL